MLTFHGATFDDLVKADFVFVFGWVWLTTGGIWWTLTIVTGCGVNLVPEVCRFFASTTAEICFCLWRKKNKIKFEIMFKYSLPNVDSHWNSKLFRTYFQNAISRLGGDSYKIKKRRKKIHLLNERERENCLSSSQIKNSILFIWLCDFFAETQAQIQCIIMFLCLNFSVICVRFFFS